MRRITIIAASAFAALALAAPVSANETLRWTDSQDISNTFSCGVVESTIVTIEGTAYFGSEGNWVKDILRFSYEASYTDSAGTTVSYQTHQVVVASPRSVALMGQGLFVRAPGAGAVLVDVGRLVIDPSDGSTLFVSAHSIPFDDPTGMDRYDAAICSLF